MLFKYLKNRISEFVTFLGPLRGITSDPLGMLGLVLVVLIVGCGLLANILMPFDPNQIDISNMLQMPTTTHWLGTDQLGRDVLSRVLAGGQIALTVAFISIFGAGFIGLILGLIAGYGPVWLDKIIIIYFDTMYSFPTVVFALAVVTLTGPGLYTVIMIIVVTCNPVYGRIVRAQTQSLKNNEFILAERAMGASAFRVLMFHILPNVVGPLLILASMDIPTVITLEAGLSFLGLGVRPPTPSWGAILNDGYTVLRQSPWLVIAAGVPLVLTTLGFTFLSESLRDIFDPKLRKDY